MQVTPAFDYTGHKYLNEAYIYKALLLMGVSSPLMRSRLAIVPIVLKMASGNLI